MSDTLTPSLVSKHPNMGTTIFTVMSALANQYRSVNLGQGFPDFDCDPRLLDDGEISITLPWRMQAVPIGSVLLASALPALPFISDAPLFPPAGFLMLLAWQARFEKTAC